MSAEKSEYFEQLTQNRQESQQQVVDVEFDVAVKDWWIEGGRLVIPKENRPVLSKAGRANCSH